MFDLDLLKSFVSVVDAGGFTRASERVHRTQSTVSQQIRKLEAAVGRPLLKRQRAGKGIVPTEEGEILLVYARRLLTIAAEAQDVLFRPEPVAVARLGVPEDFAGRRLTDLLAGFARHHPHIRLDTTSGLSAHLQAGLAAGEIDLALVKREPGDGKSLAHWPERLVWVAGKDADLSEDPVPLAVFPQRCLYRARAIHALERAGRRWRIAYGSQGLIGIQAAVSSGLGISILSTDAVLPDHRLLGEADGFADPAPTELALIAGDGRLPPALKAVAGYLEAALGEGGDISPRIARQPAGDAAVPVRSNGVTVA
ncbi:MAG TPA: LysR substrate-binding domain-containing protein [Dongiaceae bacterium]|nr:LysR substrate-binding domain-containing protein [Dongiaceae bacterium]